MPAEPPGSRISTGRSYPFPLPCAATASTGGLRSRTGALLVLPRDRRNPDRNTPRQRIREEAGRGRGRVLAAGAGKPLARTGQRGTGAARNARAHGDSEADVRLWRRSLEELAQGRG